MNPTRTFGQRLALGFGLVVLLTAVMAIVAYVALRGSVVSHDAVFDHDVANLHDTERVRTAAAHRSASARAFLLTADARFEQSMAESDKVLGDTLGRIGARQLSTQARQALADVESANTGFRTESGRVNALRRTSSDLAAIEREFETLVLPRWDELQRGLRALESISESELAAARADADQAADSALALVIGIGVASLLLAIAIAALLTRALGRQIGSSVQHVRSSSAELQAAATQQASSAKEQATAMNEIATTIAELLVTARQIAASAQRVARITADASTGARSGTSQVQGAQEAIVAIRRQIDQLVQHVLDLGKRSQQIGGIVEIITELAEQTNILAINASIEAAGAGEAGRRFGVVGEEIRRLADRVAGSTKEIRALVDDIRGSVNTTVMATESGSKAVEAAGARFVDLTEVFRRIAEGVATTNEAAREIELSTQQQTTAVEQVNVAIGSAAQATRESESSATQTLQTASQLATMSRELQRLVQKSEA